MAELNAIDLLKDVTANTTGAWHKVDIHQAAVFAGGDFDGATVKLQGSPDGIVAYDSEDATFTAQAWAVSTLGQIYIRGVVEDAGGGTEVSLSIRPIISSVAQV